MSSGKFILPIVLSLMVFTPVSFANAQAPGPESGRPDVSQFLTQAPAGGGNLVSLVRNILTSDKAALAPIIGLLPNANKDQQDAIADGLAQAAKLYLRTDPNFATEIQQAVAAAGNADFIKAYASIAGDTGTASTGGGGGGGGGGPTTNNASTGGVNSGTSPFSNNATRNSAVNLFTGGTASSASPSPSSF